MVDAYAVNEAFGIEAKQRGVHRFEHFAILDAHGREFVNVEEATPIDLVVGASPPGQSVVLSLQKVMQLLAACRRVCCKPAKRTGINTAAIGRHREPVLKITNDKFVALVPSQLNLAGRQRLTVWPAQNRQEDFAVQLRMGGHPA